MGHLEDQYFDRNEKPLIYHRYVDDCFLMFRDKDECDKMFKAINAIHPSIEFTMETEVNNTLPFLDVLVERTKDKFITSVYRKSTFTGQYVNFQSFCNRKRKRNLIQTLYDRAVRICSPETLDKEIEKIANILQENGYPKKLIERVIDRRKQGTMNQQSTEPELQIIPLRLPFIGEQSYYLEKNINREISGCYKTVKARLIFRSNPNFPNAVKDHIPDLSKNMVVYQFKCRCDNDYVGQTSRRLIQRIQEHVPKCVKEYICDPNYDFTENIKLVRANAKSSIAKHLLESRECGLTYNIDMFSILRRCTNMYELKVFEAVIIGILEPSLCVQTKFDYVASLI